MFFLLFLYFFVFVLSFYLLVFLWLNPVVETFDSISVLVPLFLVPDSDFDSAFTASASFRWLLQFLYRGSDGFALICASFAFITVLCCPLRGMSHMFDVFSTIYLYFCIFFLSFWDCCWEATPFSVLGSLARSSFHIKSGKDPSS